MDKNEVLQSQENQTKNVMQEIKEEYAKTADFLEDNTNQQLNIAEELKGEMQNKDFDVNIEELKALKEEITGLKAEIKRLNDLKDPRIIISQGGELGDFKYFSKELLPTMDQEDTRAKVMSSIEKLYPKEDNEKSEV